MHAFSSVIFFLFDHMAKAEDKQSTSRSEIISVESEEFLHRRKFLAARVSWSWAECEVLSRAPHDENKSPPTRSGGRKGATLSMVPLEFFPFSWDIAGYERKEFAWRHRKTNCRGRWNHEWMGIEVDCSFALWFIHWIVFWPPRRWKSFSDEATARCALSSITQKSHRKFMNEKRYKLRCRRWLRRRESRVPLKSAWITPFFTLDGDIARAHLSKVGKRAGKTAAMITSQSKTARGKQILTRAGGKQSNTPWETKKVGKPGWRRNENLISARKLGAMIFSRETNSDAENLCEDEKANAGSSMYLFPRESELFLSPTD